MRSVSVGFSEGDILLAPEKNQVTLSKQITGNKKYQVVMCS